MSNDWIVCKGNFLGGGKGEERAKEIQATGAYYGGEVQWNWMKSELTN